MENMPQDKLLAFSDIINEWSIKLNLDKRLIRAIILTESSGNPWATRYEPIFNFYYKTKEMALFKRNSEETEKALQRISWGLMQVMGATARDLGFRGDITELCRPALGIEYGCKYLRHLSDKYNDLGDIIASYNWGSPRKTAGGDFYINQNYVDKVKGNFPTT